MDNKEVLLASIFNGALPVSEVKRFDKIGKQKKSDPCPNVVKVYNKVMGA